MQVAGAPQGHRGPGEDDRLPPAHVCWRLSSEKVLEVSNGLPDKHHGVRSAIAKTPADRRQAPVPDSVNAKPALPGNDG